MIGYIIEGIIAVGIIGLLLIYISGLKEELSNTIKSNRKNEKDLLWWQNYADEISEKKADILTAHEERLKLLENRNKELERELDAKNDEILLLENQLSAYGINNPDDIFKPLRDGLVAIDLDRSPLKYVEANSIREATKDLDFPNSSEAINKFMTRQAKKED